MIGNPHSEFVLCIYLFKCTHIVVSSEHTHTQSVVDKDEGGKSVVHSVPHLHFLPVLRLEPATFGLQIQLSNHSRNCPNTTITVQIDQLMHKRKNIYSTSQLTEIMVNNVINA